MNIRKPIQKDAVYMLEWMHDEEVVRFMATDFGSKTLQDCEQFIQSCENDSHNLHRAIVSDDDEYMGTVSLKHIDAELGNAEFAITVRSTAMGKGYAWYGMTEILRIAFEELQLKCVYWCVSNENIRGCKFYDKHGFSRVVDIPEELLQRYRDTDNIRWYSVLNGDDYLNAVLGRGEIAGCKVIKINTIATVSTGELSFFEEGRDIPFDVKRLYYISRVPEGGRRGFHAHKKLKQLLFCPYGKVQLTLDDGTKREQIILSDPSVGIVVEKPIWREMLWMQKDSVLCVAASDFYDPEDYIRDYESFKEYIDKEKK